MKNKQKQTYWLVGIIVLILLALWFWQSRHQANAPVKNQENSNNTTTQDNLPTQNGPVWTGLLKASDSPQKGNLMLVTSGRNIYIKTSRDFSALVNKEVIMTYQGDYNNFQLGNITAK